MKSKLAKDLQPGDRFKPPFRRTIEEVEAVGLYGETASVSFVSGRVGAMLKQAERVKLEPAPKAKALGPKLRKRLAGRQSGDVLPDGTMVADPANALLELHDQANLAPAPKAAPTAPMATKADPPTKLWDVVAGIYPDKPQREAAKRRLRTLVNKLQRLPEAERRAFLPYLNTLFP